MTPETEMRGDEDVCVKCERPMLRCRKRAGVRTHAARGMCRNCYGLDRRSAGTRGSRGARRPGADVDEIAVERAMHGEPVPLNAVERRVAVAELTRRGYSTAEIARRTGLASRSVQRLRTKSKDAA